MSLCEHAAHPLLAQCTAWMTSSHGPEALKDFDAALVAVPNDAAITRERTRVARLVADGKAAQKARMAKMFS